MFVYCEVENTNLEATPLFSLKNSVMLTFLDEMKNSDFSRITDFEARQEIKHVVTCFTDIKNRFVKSALVSIMELIIALMFIFLMMVQRYCYDVSKFSGSKILVLF